MVIDRRVDVGVAHPPSRPAPFASVHLPPTPVRDPAELLDIDVDQVPRSGVLVAADGASGGPVEPAEPIQAESVEYPVDGGGREPQPVGDACGAELQPATELRDAALDARPCSPRVPKRAGRAVVESLRTLGQPAAPPAVRSLPGDPHLARDVGDWTTGSDPLDEQQTPGRGELRVRVHRGPPGVGWLW